MKDKPLYVAAILHKFLKAYARKNGGKLKTITDSVIKSGIKTLKLK